MSEEETKEQAVVDGTDGQAAPAPEGTDARDGDDLDALLSQYDETEPKAPKSEPEAKPATDPDLKTLAEQVKAMHSAQTAQQFRKDMDETIKNIRGDLDAEFFDDEFVESWVDARARQDPRLSLAWANRHNNPKQFAKVREQLGRAFEKKFSKMPDAKATEDRELVTQSLRGASGKAPEGKAPDYGALSDREFAEAVKKEHGFIPL